MEAARMPTFAVSSAGVLAKARLAMKSDMVKPIPPSRPTPNLLRASYCSPTSPLTPLRVASQENRAIPRGLPRTSRRSPRGEPDPPGRPSPRSPGRTLRVRQREQRHDDMLDPGRQRVLETQHGRFLPSSAGGVFRDSGGFLGDAASLPCCAGIVIASNTPATVA